LSKAQKKSCLDKVKNFKLKKFGLMSDIINMQSTALPCNGCTEVDDVNKPPFNLGALSISFSGCGFLGIYHMGVAAALRQYIPGNTWI